MGVRLFRMPACTASLQQFGVWFSLCTLYNGILNSHVQVHTIAGLILQPSHQLSPSQTFVKQTWEPWT